MVEPTQQVYALPLKVCDSCWCQYSPTCKWSKNLTVVSTLARQPGSQRDHLYLGVMRADSFPGSLSCCKASILIVFTEVVHLNLNLSSGKGGCRCRQSLAALLLMGMGTALSSQGGRLHQCQWSNSFNQIETAKPAWSEKYVLKSQLKPSLLALSWSFDWCLNTITEPVSRKYVIAFLIFCCFW